MSDKPPEVKYIGPCPTCGTGRYINWFGSQEQLDHAAAQVHCAHCRETHNADS